MFRLLRNSTIIIMWALSSFAIEENLQHHVEGVHISRKTNTVGTEFTCQYELQQILPSVRVKRRCQTQCIKTSDCTGYRFDRRTDGPNTCTLYSASDGFTQHCVKTAVILGTSEKFSCARGDTRSFTDVRHVHECEIRCEHDDCYGFEYNRKQESCDVFMLRGDATNGVRCDKKVTCPCFSNDEVENAASELRQGIRTANLQETSCQTTEGSYGLYYMDDVFVASNQRTFNSFAVSVGNTNQERTCTKDNTPTSILEKEEAVCRAQLQNSCNTLNDNRVSLDGTCQCYNENDLNEAIGSINNGSKVLQDTSCQRNTGITMSFFYESASNSAMVEGYGVYSSQYSKRCTFSGDMRLQHISAQSAVDCFRIIEEACDQLT